MAKTQNPYSTTVASSNLDTASRPPRMAVTILAMLLLSAGLWITIGIIGPTVLRWIFSWKDPSYWFDVLPIGNIANFKSDSERLDRLGVMAERYSIALSFLGFFVGLVLPVLRHIWLAQKHRNAASA